MWGEAWGDDDGSLAQVSLVLRSCRYIRSIVSGAVGMISCVQPVLMDCRPHSLGSSLAPTSVSLAHLYFEGAWVSNQTCGQVWLHWQLSWLPALLTFLLVVCVYMTLARWHVVWCLQEHARGLGLGKGSGGGPLPRPLAHELACQSLPDVQPRREEQTQGCCGRVEQRKGEWRRCHLSRGRQLQVPWAVLSQLSHDKTIIGHCCCRACSEFGPMLCLSACIPL